MGHSHAHHHGHDHHHGHHHDHGHEGHSHSAQGIPKQRLLQSLVFSLAITVAQIVGGVISGSLALMSDALHTATDAVALLASYCAIRLGERPGTTRHTFGLKRAEIVAAALNAGILIGISLWLLWEAGMRFFHPEQVEAGVMIGVAAIGLVANLIMSALLHKGSKANINMRSAYLHVLSDAMVSVGVIAGGIAIAVLGEGFTWIDPLLTVMISLWLIRASWGIVGESLRILLMGAPPGIEIDEVAARLTRIDGIRGVHHVHLWSLNDQTIHFEAHIEIDDRLVSETACLADQIEDALHDDFEITHATLQFESGRCADTALIAHAAQ